jgi:hypothetical protein
MGHIYTKWTSKAVHLCRTPVTHKKAQDDIIVNNVQMMKENIQEILQKKVFDPLQKDGPIKLQPLVRPTVIITAMCEPKPFARSADVLLHFEGINQRSQKEISTTPESKRTHKVFDQKWNTTWTTKVTLDNGLHTACNAEI